MNASQRRKAARKGAQPGDIVQWQCKRIGWLTGTVRRIYRTEPLIRSVREVDGRLHDLHVAQLTIKERFIP